MHYGFTCLNTPSTLLPLVVLVYALVVLVCPFIFLFALLVCPLVISVCPLVLLVWLFVTPLVALAVVGPFITDPLKAVNKAITRTCY